MWTGGIVHSRRTPAGSTMLLSLNQASLPAARSLISPSTVRIPLTGMVTPARGSLLPIFLVLERARSMFSVDPSTDAETREFDSKRFNDFSSSLTNFFTTAIVIALSDKTIAVLSSHQQTPREDRNSSHCGTALNASALST